MKMKNRFKPNMISFKPRGYRPYTLPYPIRESREGYVNSLMALRRELESKLKEDTLYTKLIRVIDREIDR